MENDQLVPSGQEESRVMMQVQAQVLMAKRFPRDQDQSRVEILKICQNQKMANIATYSYNRGNTSIERPSIQMAKAMALAWGNLDYNWYEFERRKGTKQKPGESHIVVYCWDMQTNTKASRSFVVGHWRDTQAGGYAITDERDIYELCANMASRRMRECILDVIPKDIEEDAVKTIRETIKKTMESSPDASKQDRIEELVQKFIDLGVTKAMLEKRLGKPCEEMIMIDIIKYQGVYLTLKDEEQSIESAFPSAKKPSGKNIMRDDSPPKVSFVEKLTMIVDENEYKTAIQSLINEKKITNPDELRTKNEAAAKDIFEMIERQKGFEDDAANES